MNQRKCCDFYGVSVAEVKVDQLVVISKGVYKIDASVEGVRHQAPDHMSGWWLTTDEYDDNLESLITVHFSHIVEHRPELAQYMALPCGYRFNLGGESENVWFDQGVANESV